MKKMRRNADLPNFTFKGAAILLLGALVGTFVIPLTTTALGIHSNWFDLFATSTIFSFLVPYVTLVMDKKQGFTKKFWIVFGLIFVITNIICYYWIFFDIHI